MNRIIKQHVVLQAVGKQIQKAVTDLTEVVEPALGVVVKIWDQVFNLDRN
jgi:hypothetical protein